MRKRIRRYSQAMFVLVFFAGAQAQTQFSAPARLQGYALAGDSAFFVFDEKLYGVQPQRVVIEGEMRGWDHNMEDKEWRMARSLNEHGLWSLACANPAFANIKPGAQFKFRIDDGVWLDAPASAPNQKGGNLVFAHEVTPTHVRAELVSAHHVQPPLSCRRDCRTTSVRYF